MIEIRDGVPVPEVTKRPGGGKVKYPFRDLKVGQSFFISTDDPYALRGNIYCALHSLKKRRKEPLAGEFIVRIVEGGVGVWRTE